MRALNSDSGAFVLEVRKVKRHPVSECVALLSRLFAVFITKFPQSWIKYRRTVSRKDSNCLFVLSLLPSSFRIVQNQLHWLYGRGTILLVYFSVFRHWRWQVTCDKFRWQVTDDKFSVGSSFREAWTSNKSARITITILRWSRMWMKRNQCLAIVRWLFHRRV